MEPVFIVQAVQDKLHRVEAAIEAAMKETSELLVLTIDAKRDLALSPTVGLRETAGIIKAVDSLGLAHETIAETHSGLSALVRRKGLRTKATGVWKDEATLRQEPTTLRRSV